MGAEIAKAYVVCGLTGQVPGWPERAGGILSPWTDWPRCPSSWRHSGWVGALSLWFSECSGALSGLRPTDPPREHRGPGDIQRLFCNCSQLQRDPLGHGCWAPLDTDFPARSGNTGASCKPTELTSHFRGSHGERTENRPPAKQKKAQRLFF